jgi:SAM-dependent methyltransferase
VSTWHYGLVAEWWAHFNTEGPEIDYFRRRIEPERPVLDAGCGTGRLLVPWLQAGLDVDGCDVSADMIALARERARAEGLDPTLFVQPLHELDPPRRYGSIVVCGVLGLGTTRAQDEEGLRRLRASLQPGGLLLLDNEASFAPPPLELPTSWREPQTLKAADGTEYSLRSRWLSGDLDDRCWRLVLRAEKRRDGELVAEEEHELTMREYAREEVEAVLARVGFENVEVEHGYSDDFDVFAARR